MPYFDHPLSVTAGVRQTIEKNYRPRHSNGITGAVDRWKAGPQFLQNRKTNPVEMRAVHLFFT